MFLARRVNYFRSVQALCQSQPLAGAAIATTRAYSSSDPPKERDIIKIIWTNFVNSLRPRKIKGNLIGSDSFGNKYFEIPADPSIGKRKDTRWFDPPVKDTYDQEIPAEWEAWLRGRRKIPPTEDELRTNQAIADMKKVNAAELEKQHNPERAAAPKEETIKTFPTYPDYEVMPGDKLDRDK